MLSPARLLLVLLLSCGEPPPAGKPPGGEGAGGEDGDTEVSRDTGGLADGGGGGSDGAEGSADGADGADGADSTGDGAGTEGSGGDSAAPPTDTDGDGLTDEEEYAGIERDADHDGVPDYLDLDSDGDGISDEVEGAPRGSEGGPADTDGDGAPDFIDQDSDNDSITDATEALPLGSLGEPADTDGDGTGDWRDEDTDGDGMSDRVEGLEDWDGDGVENWRDTRNDGSASPLLFVGISTTFNSPIGIDFHEYSATVVMSVNYPSGTPSALEQVAADGTHSSFSTISGLSDEVKIATARADNPAGFIAGELFVGNGVDGQIVRISRDGGTITNPWVDLPGSGNGLMRGSLYVDRTGVWGGDLLVATTLGEVWRIDAAGTPTQVADVGSVHLEGLITVPDCPDRFGPLAGKAIAGAESEGLLYSFATDGTWETHSVGVLVEDIDIISPYENFFGVNFGTSRLIGVSADEWRPIAGDILLTMETVYRVGLYRLYWDGSALRTEELSAASGSAPLGQWEHVTFARAGIQEIPALPTP